LQGSEAAAAAPNRSAVPWVGVTGMPWRAATTAVAKRRGLLVARDEAGLRGGLGDGHAGLPVRAELGGNAKPAHPLLAHRGGLVRRPHDVERERTQGRAIARQWNAVDGGVRGLGQEERDLVAAAAALAGTHARAGEPLDLVLVDGTVA